MSVQLIPRLSITSFVYHVWDQVSDSGSVHLILRLSKFSIPCKHKFGNETNLFWFALIFRVSRASGHCNWRSKTILAEQYTLYWAKVLPILFIDFVISHSWLKFSFLVGKCLQYISYPGGVASRLATIIYVAMIMPIYDNSDSPNDSNTKYENCQTFFEYWYVIWWFVSHLRPMRIWVIIGQTRIVILIGNVNWHYHGNINDGCEATPPG